MLRGVRINSKDDDAIGIAFTTLLVLQAAFCFLKNCCHHDLKDVNVKM